jgi:hypothetical protein
MVAITGVMICLYKSIPRTQTRQVLTPINTSNALSRVGLQYDRPAWQSPAAWKSIDWTTAANNTDEPAELAASRIPAVCNRFLAICAVLTSTKRFRAAVDQFLATLGLPGLPL